MTVGTSATGASRRDRLMFVDGTFEELALEMAQHLNIVDDVNELLEKKDNDEVLKKLVMASPNIHSMPESFFQPAYNLLIYIVLESPNYRIFLPKICEHLCTKPVTTSPFNGPQLALFALQTIFNLLEETNDMRFNAYSTIVRFVKDHGLFDLLKPTLEKLPGWFEQWNTKPSDQRSLYVKVADLAAGAVEISADASQSEENEKLAFLYLEKALKTFTPEEASCDEAQAVALKTVRMSILSPHKYTFQDLNSIRPINSLADTHAVWSQLLDIFMEQDLEDYTDFLDEHPDFIEKEGLDAEKLHTKMRLLTITSLVAHAASGSREVEYSRIAKSLAIPTEDVEMWVIDAIKSKIISGKLSQQRKVFLVHSATYRVFSEKQWRELATRIQSTRQMLINVIDVLDKGQKEVTAQQKRDLEDIEKKLADVGFGGSDNKRPNRRNYQRRQDNDD